MRILISGSRGLIGSHLVPYLESAGHEVHAMVRSASDAKPGDVLWGPTSGTIDSAAMSGFDAVIHLAGENVVGRWTPEKKDVILRSRSEGTRLVAGTLAKLPNPPKVMISASASGFYGDRGDEILTEDSPSGSGFLPRVCREWEEATEPAREVGIRVANTRFGIVLTPHGGALEKMAAPFRLGLGGKIGSGKQYMSWIAIDDLEAGIAHILTHDDISGPINFVSPNPVTNAQFTTALAEALGRPAVLSIPEFGLRLAYGLMAEEALLASQRITPEKLLRTGFQFAYPDLKSALNHLLRGGV